MKLTLKKILALVAGALAIVAFIMAFVSPLKMAGAEVKAADLYFEEGGTIVPFIGFVLMLIAGIYLIVKQFVELPNLLYVAIALLVVGAIIVFLTKTIVIAGLVKDMGLTGAAADAAKKAYGEIIELNTGALFGGILAIVSAVVAFVAEKFIQD